MGKDLFSDPKDSIYSTTFKVVGTNTETGRGTEALGGCAFSFSFQGGLYPTRIQDTLLTDVQSCDPFFCFVLRLTKRRDRFLGSRA